MPRLWIPGAVHNLIPKTQSDPYIHPVGAVFHVAVSEASSLHDFFQNQSGGIESTGYIRRDGTFEQYRPMNVQCDAQVAGNSWMEGGRLVGLTSWETQGMEMGDWTPEQVATIQKIISFHIRDWGVPARICPDPTSPGFGIHNMFSAWNPDGHTCPGPDRTQQWHTTIAPWISGGAQKGDWFTVATEAELRKIIREEVGSAQIVVDPGGKGTADDKVQSLNSVMRQLLNDEAHLKETIASQANRLKQSILAALPASGAGLTTDQVSTAVEDGIRAVLGSLDNGPTA